MADTSVTTTAHFLQQKATGGGGVLDRPTDRATAPLVTSRIFHRNPSSDQDILCYTSTVKVLRSGDHSHIIPPQHTQTTEFSKTARYRAFFFLENTKHVYRSQFVGTYANCWPINGAEFCRQIDRMNKALKRRGIKFAYFKEFQTRGAPHVHWYMDAEYSDHLWHDLGKAWHRIAGYGEEKHRWWHCDRIEKNGYRSLIAWEMSSAYPMKYMTKQAQKDIPPGFKNFGSFWGHSRNLKPEIEFQLSREQLEEDHRKDEIADLDTGEIIQDQRKPFEELYRTLGRYDQHRRGKKYSHVRRSARSVSIHGGTQIIKQLTQYWRKTDENSENCGKRSYSSSPRGSRSGNNRRNHHCPF